MNPAFMTHLSAQEFDSLRNLLRRVTGINLTDSKRELMRSRLARRLRALELTCYGDYYLHLRDRDPDGTELREMVNAMTTNKTSFFREPYQFEWLRDEVLPAMKARARQGGPRRVRVWSAGCSTGAEPYSIAMLLRETLEPGWDLSILASDIDTQVLAVAEAGVYERAQLEGVDDRTLRRHFLRGRGASDGRFKVRPSLQELITFKQINLIEPWTMLARFDLIFCRNVSIYFSRETQATVFPRLADQLVDGGYLLVGHSESLAGMRLPLEALPGNVYRRPTTAPASPSRPKASVAPARPASLPAAGIDRERIHVGTEGTASSSAPLLARIAGSVAVCVYDPGTTVGGLAHLPPEGTGSAALLRLLERLRQLGAAPARLEAKVVAASAASIEAVRETLAGLGIKMVNQRVVRGGAADIRFLPAAGRVQLGPVQEQS